jgi:hypothetical protein
MRQQLSWTGKRLGLQNLVKTLVASVAPPLQRTPVGHRGTTDAQGEVHLRGCRTRNSPTAPPRRGEPSLEVASPRRCSLLLALAAVGCTASSSSQTSIPPALQFDNPATFTLAASEYTPTAQEKSELMAASLLLVEALATSTLSPDFAKAKLDQSLYALARHYPAFFVADPSALQPPTFSPASSSAGSGASFAAEPSKASGGELGLVQRLHPTAASAATVDCSKPCGSPFRLTLSGADSAAEAAMLGRLVALREASSGLIARVETAIEIATETGTKALLGSLFTIQEVDAWANAQASAVGTGAALPVIADPANALAASVIGALATAAIFGRPLSQGVGEINACLSLKAAANCCGNKNGIPGQACCSDASQGTSCCCDSGAATCTSTTSADGKTTCGGQCCGSKQLCEAALNQCCGEPLTGCPSSYPFPAQLALGCCANTSRSCAEPTVCIDSCGNEWYEVNASVYGPCNVNTPDQGGACWNQAGVKACSACAGTSPTCN